MSEYPPEFYTADLYAPPSATNAPGPYARVNGQPPVPVVIPGVNDPIPAAPPIFNNVHVYMNGMPMNIPIPMPMNPPQLVAGMGPPVPASAPQHMAAQGPPLQMPPFPQGPLPLPPLVNPSGQPPLPPLTHLPQQTQPTLPSATGPPEQSQPALPPLINPPQQNWPTLPPC